MANEFLITQTACNSFEITNNTGNEDVLLYAYKYNEVLPTTETYKFISNGDKYTLTLNDGVYHLQFYDPTAVKTYHTPLFIYCAVQNCMESLLDKLLCNEDCPDCQDCNDIASKEHSDYQFEMNKITVLFWMILGYINWEKVAYLNQWDWSSARGLLVTKIGKMFDKINSIAGRCDACGGQ